MRSWPVLATLRRGLGLSTLAVANVLAQEPAAGTVVKSALTGIVRDTLGRPVDRVSISVGHIAATSDDSGRFRVEGIPAGRNAVTAMRMGFRPLTFDTTFAAGSTLVVAIRLQVVPIVDEVRVSAEAVSPRLARTGFYERRRTGRGSYLTPQRIDSLFFASTPSKLLRDVRGIDVRCRGSTCRVVTRREPDCLWLFVDGSYTNSQIDEVLSTNQVYAIEVYERPSLVPVEFHAPLPPKRDRLTVSAGCGALVVWTKGRAG